MENVETNNTDQVNDLCDETESIDTDGITESDSSEPIKNEIIDDGKVSLSEDDETTCFRGKSGSNELSEPNENDDDLNDMNDFSEINENNDDSNELTEPTKVNSLNIGA